MNTLFLTCAVIGAVILVAQLLLGTLGAHHGTAHIGDSHHGSGPGLSHAIAPHHANSHASSTGEGLELLSARSLAAGVAFFGIGGLAAMSRNWSLPLAVGAAVALGASAMLGVAFAMRSMLKLEHDGSVDIHRAVGESATVYVPVPPSLEGSGKVTLTLQGRTVEYQAVTAEGERLPTGTAVLIVEVRNDDTVEVVPLPSLEGVL